MHDLINLRQFHERITPVLAAKAPQGVSIYEEHGDLIVSHNGKVQLAMHMANMFITARSALTQTEQIWGTFDQVQRAVRRCCDPLWPQVDGKQGEFTAEPEAGGTAVYLVVGNTKERIGFVEWASLG